MSNKNILNLDLKDIFTNMVNNYLTENKIGKKIDRKTINLFNYDGISNNIENLDNNEDILEDIFCLINVIKKEKKLE